MLRICSAFVLVFLAVPALAGPSGPIRVIDADTIMVGPVKVRLHGIDAPELGQPCRDPQGAIQDCGVLAAQEARARWQGRQAECDALDRDRYGRVVAICHVDGEDIGRTLVAEGFAVAFRRYSMAYDLEEKSAVISGRGLHAYEMERPEVHRNTRAAAPPTDAGSAQGCEIKGNISRDGKRIYHMPGQEHYDRTRINPKTGERWFCSAVEAERAGWRRARR